MTDGPKKPDDDVPEYKLPDSSQYSLPDDELGGSLAPDPSYRAQLDFADVPQREEAPAPVNPMEAPPLELDDHRPKQPAPSPPEPEADQAPPAASPPPPRPSAPGGVRSAARAAPLPEEKKKLTKEALREGAVEVLLNSFSILREVADDFRSSDKFFKYKAAVLATWFVLVCTSFGVSCSGAAPTNAFGARLIIAGENQAERAYMIKNDSDDEWQNVQITVNGKYYVTAAQLHPQGDISLSPRLMFDENGKEAPPGTVIGEIHLSCSEGDTFLLKDGKAQQP